ncbi:FAD-dependent monooxygenase [Isoptericola sp. AK164]|uniref:FAD-dependent monooxygenase n=1 Tax=Isoptericola sp. AK164 TaxID=3024246 RepID=UPI0024186176|nr:FAD-dependent monooxygenase [Isoptericola sp. AK164]
MTDVLVVGAGPTGLATALQAHDHGAAVRVVERRPTAWRPSRAMIVHPHTLESLRPLGVAEALLDRADRSPRAQVHLGRRLVDVRLADVDWPATPYPHLTMVRQADVEDVLAQALAARGVTVERGTECVAARDGGTAGTDAGAVRAVLRAEGGDEEATARFLAGCDGPESTVRRGAGTAWRGGPYPVEVLLADLELDGDLAPGVLHAVVARRGLVFLFALGEGAPWRLLATRPASDGGAPVGQPGAPVPADEVAALLDDAGLGATLAGLRWSARVRLQHRVAGSFRQGRIFLAGDAAHTHSPAAAQGMNSGLLDAVNLGWKLALAAGTADPSRDTDSPLLASYDAERRSVARQVLALTHLVFFGEASTHPLPALLRGTVLPLAAPVVPLAVRRRRLMGLVVRLLSQDWVAYRHSPLTVAGRPARAAPRPGHRLRDQDVTCAGRTRRLHELTASPGVHVLLDRDAPALDPGDLGPHVAVHRLASSPGRGVVAVRPDGFVGYTDAGGAPRGLSDWLGRVGARPAAR